MCQKHGNVRSGKSLLLRELLPTDQMWRLPHPAKSPRRNAGDFSYLFVKDICTSLCFPLSHYFVMK